MNNWCVVAALNMWYFLVTFCLNHVWMLAFLLPWFWWVARWQWREIKAKTRPALLDSGLH